MACHNKREKCSKERPRCRNCESRGISCLHHDNQCSANKNPPVMSHPVTSLIVPGDLSLSVKKIQPMERNGSIELPDVERSGALELAIDIGIRFLLSTSG